MLKNKLVKNFNSTKSLKVWLNADRSANGIGDETASSRLEVHVFLCFAGRMGAAGKNDLRLKNDPVYHDPSRWIFFEESLGMVSIGLNQPFIQ